MLPYIGRRLLTTIPVMGVVAVFVFLLLRLTAGDPAAIIAGDNATGQDVAQIREKLGLSTADVVAVPAPALVAATARPVAPDRKK